MLEKYKYEQDVVYNILMNAFKNNKLSHAYLFDSNENSDIMDLVLSFVKMIVTVDISDEQEKENICNRIDDGNYIDVKVIEPDGMWIKKNQLIDLQNEFSKKAIEGNKKVYVIKSSEKMNSQTANSLLKFLEEPVDDIIAILIVNNINLVLPTIISRCQVIKLNKNKYTANTIDNFNSLYRQTKYDKMSIDEKESVINSTLKFIEFLECNEINTLIYLKSIWHNTFKDRENNLLAINLCVIFYNDLLKFKSGLKTLFYYDKIDILEKIASMNDLSSIINKIEILDKFEYYLQRNLNINLLMDEMVIEMCGE